MKCKPWIRHFSPPKFQCFSSQFALHGLRALECGHGPGSIDPRFPAAWPFRVPEIPEFVSVCAPLCCKNMCCASRVCTGGREAGGSRSKNLLEVPWKEMLGQGHTLRLLDEAREVGRDQHPGPENQESQHMIDQPRGYAGSGLPQGRF